MRRPTLIIVSCLSYILGIIAGYNFLFETNIYWLIFILLAIGSSFLLKNKLKIFPLVLASFCLGIIILNTQMSTFANNGLSNYFYQKAEVTGTVKGDPYWDEDKNYVFIISNVMVNGQSKYGDIRIKTFSSFAREGYVVRVKGKIYPVLAKPGSQISFANVEILQIREPVLVRIKNYFYSGLDRALSQNSASFMKGILIGSRSLLGKNVQDTLNAVGLSHMVAVSGYNLTILVVLLQRFLRRRWAWGGLVLSLVVVWAFTLLVGASASITRAAIMATVFLIASYYGRPVGIFTCISLTAAITLAINPTAVIEDIGWQLSFLSLTGIVIISPLIIRLLPKKLSLLNEALAITIAAQIATVPYVMFIFGKFSLASIISNLVLMPIIPILMLIGFMAAIMGIVLPNYAYILGLPINKLIDIIFDFLKFLQTKTNLVVSIQPRIITLLVWYSALAIMGAIVYHRRLYDELPAFQKQPKMLK